MKRSAGHVTDLLPEYVLGLLSGRERRRAERHLGRCAGCRAELASWEAVTDDLARAPFPAEPPEALAERILARLPAGGGRLRAPRLAGGWAIAVLAVLVASAAANVVLWRRVQVAQAVYADTLSVPMVGTEAALGAAGTLVPSIDGRHATLTVQGLPHLTSGRQYQLWLVKDGARTSGGVFSADNSGRACLVLTPPQRLATYTAFGVTVEPWGGSPGPTGPRVLGGRR
jgi:anti-sigma-K factor RskA